MQLIARLREGPPAETRSGTVADPFATGSKQHVVPLNSTDLPGNK